MKWLKACSFPFQHQFFVELSQAEPSMFQFMILIEGNLDEFCLPNASEYVFQYRLWSE